MANIYNSKIIRDLYATSNTDEAERLLEEIEEIKDPIFLWPLFDAYARFKETSIPHYFISALNQIDSREVIEILKEIIGDPHVTPLVFTYALEGFLKYEYFDEIITSRAKSILIEFSVRKTNINFPTLLSYLEKGGSLKDIDVHLKNIFESEKFYTEDRLDALNFLLKSDSKKWFNYYIEHYSEIPNQSTEILLSKAVLTWKGVLVDKLIEKIENSRNPRAIEIIQKNKEKVTKEIKEEAKNESVIFPNSAIISEIMDLRGKINLLSQNHVALATAFFPPNETIFKQLKAVSSEEELRGNCIQLRSFIQNINPEAQNHGLTFEDSKEILNDMSEADFKKSINQFHLFLRVKGINVDSDLYGLRTLNRILNLFAHPEGKTDLLNALTKLKVDDLYKQGDWNSLQRLFLNLYLQSLKKLHQNVLT